MGYGDTKNRGSSAITMGNQLPFLDLGAGATASSVAVGAYHACAIVEADSRCGLRCWGSPSNGRLGYGSIQQRGSTSRGDVGYVNLGIGSSPTSVVAGLGFTCVLTANGKVKCFGLNTYGQLGTGDTLDRGSTPGTVGDNLPFVDLGTDYVATQLYAGLNHWCAVFSAARR